MNNVVEGINEDELSNLSLEIVDYADRITEIFDKIDLCMSRLPDYYQCDSCTQLVNFYNELLPYYDVIKNNILSYSDDFIVLIRKMQDNDKYLASLFDNYTEDVKQKTKSIVN